MIMGAMLRCRLATASLVVSAGRLMSSGWVRLKSDKAVLTKVLVPSESKITTIKVTTSSDWRVTGHRVIEETG